MKRIIIMLSTITSLSLIYTLMVPLKSDMRIGYVVDKYFSIYESYVSDESDGYFVSDDKCGFFSSSKGMSFLYESNPGRNTEEVLFYETDPDFVPKKMSGNIYGFTVYDKSGTSLSFFSNDGVLKNTVESKGYPYVSEKYPYVYLISPTGKDYSFYTMDGKVIYKDQGFNSLITSISVDKEGSTLVSTIDGRSYLINIEKKILFMTESRDSKIKFTKSNAIDMNGKYLALQSGLYPEIIEIYESETKTSIHQLKTDTNFRYSPFLKFYNNNLYYEGQNSLNYFNLVKEEIYSLNISGEIEEVTFSDKGFIGILSRDKYFSYLNIYTDTGIKVFYSEFESKIDNINFINNSLFYFKLDDKIVTIKTKLTA